jgi:hypothetical protein
VRALALAALLAAPAAAEAVLEQATERYEVSLTIDDRLATGWPELAAARRAEGVAAIETFKREADADTDSFGRPYTFAWTEEAPFVSDRYVSVLSTVDFYTGGAHGNRGVRAATWDRTTGEPVALSAFLSPEGVASVAAEVAARVATQVHGGDVPEFWREAVAQATTPARLDGFTLLPGPDGRAIGLSIPFAPYEIAPWSEGAPVIEVPAARFASGLTAQGAELFDP